jgi:DNA repair protein RecN (Recombination protein N)
MIEEISIRGLGVIDETRVRLQSGLTVLTGETGAGKTMVLTALSLLLGERADSALVREGAERLEVEAIIGDPPDDVRARVEEAGGALDDVLVVARTVSEVRSRAILGGRTVPATLLAEVGERLVAVHGQDDQRHLRRPTAQREALDRFAGPVHMADVAERRRLWTERGTVADALAALDTGAAARAERRELVRQGLAAIEEAMPQEDEAESLRVAILRAQHGQGLREDVERARDALGGTADRADRSTSKPEALGAVADVDVVQRALARCAADDPEVQDLAARAARVMGELAALQEDLAAYAASLADDPDMLEAALARKATLSRLRRHWVDQETAAPPPEGWKADDASALRQWVHRFRSEAEAPDDDALRDRLAEQLAALDDEVRDVGVRVSHQRKEAAAALGQAVTSELAGLAMTGTVFEADLTATDPGPHGDESVAFLLRSEGSGAPVAVDRAASGGERSRIMLALEVVLAASDPVPTFVFDEVDAGIGGTTALAVGERLARLGRTAQVLVVTHLPQVAAFGDQHLVVTKGSASGLTTSDVREVTGEERSVELARMLGGMSGSTLGQAHAEELLAEARRRRDRA